MREGRDNMKNRADVAVICCRVSSAGQEDNYSLDTQEDLCGTYCDEQEYPVYGEAFKDVHQRSDMEDRRGLDAALDAIRAGNANVLVLLDMDRLTSETHHLGWLQTTLERLDARIEFVQADDMERGQFGEIVRVMKATYARQELA